MIFISETLEETTHASTLILDLDSYPDSHMKDKNFTTKLHPGSYSTIFNYDFNGNLLQKLWKIYIGNLRHIFSFNL